jgi:hypothetical protein
VDCRLQEVRTIELLELDKSSTHVAEYRTTLPPRAALVEQLLHAAQHAQFQQHARD